MHGFCKILRVVSLKSLQNDVWANAFKDEFTRLTSHLEHSPEKQLQLRKAHVKVMIKQLGGAEFRHTGETADESN
jgi:hypothetical protein